jgi:uncharacterized peroxidase-related enzyme
MKFEIHTESTAPEYAQKLLSNSRAAFGAIPNLHGVMAEAPALLKAYQELGKIFSQTSLTAAEQQVVMLATSYANKCDYCVAAHTIIAGMHKVPADVVQSIRNGVEIAEPKLEALRRFTSKLVATRGWPGDEELERFVQAGYTRANVLEVVLGVGFKTLSNYTNHLAQTPLDAAFAAAAWSPAA